MERDVRGYLLILLVLGSSAHAERYLMECGFLTTRYTVEITTPERLTFVPETGKIDPKNPREIVGHVVGDRPFSLTKDKYHFVSSSNPQIREIRQSDAHYAEITLADWKTRGMEAVSGSMAISISDEAGFSIGLHVYVTAHNISVSFIEFTQNGQAQKCQVRKDQSVEPEALINAPTPMQ
jgi:hypothetical protein